MNDYNFGNTLRQIREERGLSQYQLGELLGVTNRAVSKWENGSRPKTDLLIQLSRILEVPLDMLITGAAVPAEHSCLTKPYNIWDGWNTVYDKLAEKYPGIWQYTLHNRLQSEKTCLFYHERMQQRQHLAALQQTIREKGEHVFFSADNSVYFTDWLLDISDINPLPPHYFCTGCGHIAFVPTVYSCWDLPDKTCSCGRKLHRDGFRFPAAWGHGSADRIGLLIRPAYLQEIQEDIQNAFPDHRLVPIEHTDRKRLYYLLLPSEIQTPEKIPFDIYRKEYASRYLTVFLYLSADIETFRELTRMTNTSLERIQYTAEDVLYTAQHPEEAPAFMADTCRKPLRISDRLIFQS